MKSIVEFNGNDWNENDSNSLSYIQNRPFWDSFSTYEIELTSNENPISVIGPIDWFSNDAITTYYISNCPVLEPEKIYRIEINGISVTKLAVRDGQTISFGYKDAWDVIQTQEWPAEECFFQIYDNISFLINTKYKADSYNIKIYEKKEDLVSLPKKYISEYSAGYLSPRGEKVTFNDVQYTIGVNAENFNTNTLAIGNSSRAMGYGCVSIGDYSSAEGNLSIAYEQGSHAEGYSSQTLGAYSHAEGYCAKAIGTHSHAEGCWCKANGAYSHAEGDGTTANGICEHAEGNNNIPSYVPPYSEQTFISGSASSIKADRVVYRIKSMPTLDPEKSYYDISTLDVEECLFAEIEAKDYFIFSKPENLQITTYYYYLNDDKTMITDEDGALIYNVFLTDRKISKNTYGKSKYLHIVGNGWWGSNDESNAYTLDWEGNGWFSGDVYVGSTSGTNQDEGSKKLLTEDDINSNMSFNSFILNSSTEGSAKQFKITIEDDGVLKATEIIKTEE